MTLCFDNRHTDPAFNLAAEEHLLRKTEEDIFILWRNELSVVIGRNQNPYAEINPSYVQENGIRVLRRLSGGGAVYHDLGNVNFTFIATHPEGPKIDFARYTQPIIDGLDDLGVEARFEGRNDLTIGGRKISGNAQHIFRDRVLHHGTLLYSSQLSVLNKVLNSDPDKYVDKAIRSVRSRVTNIAEYMDPPMAVETFIDRMMEIMIARVEDGRLSQFSENDINAIDRLRDEKYNTWQWNFGRSPNYAFQRRTRTPGGTVEVQLRVADGTIEEARILGDYFGERSIDEVEHALRGIKHTREAVQSQLSRFNLEEYLRGVPHQALLDCFF